MQRYSNQFHTAFAFSLLLILSVLFWGLHDKVSLYKAGAHGMPVAKAKLLSGRELATDSINQVEAMLPPALPAPAILYLISASLLVMPAARRFFGQPSLALSPSRCPAVRTRALDRRPPPLA